MLRQSRQSRQDRFLVLRNSVLYYWRRVPKALKDVDIRARLFNADGSEAEISGNGTRCVAAYLAVEHGQQNVAVRTGAGIKNC